MTLLFQSIASTNRKVKTSAIQCLIEFVKIYYEYLGNIYAPIWEATSSLIVGTDKDLAILAIEVWNTIANEDKDRTPGGTDVYYFNKNFAKINLGKS